MKFLVTKDLAHTTLLVNLMAGVVFSLFFYLALDIVLHAYVVGLDVTTLSTTLYGNTEEFIEPILIDTLLLQVHIDLFMSLFTIMIVASIYIRLHSTKVMTKWLVHILFILGLLSPILLLVAYFTSAGFVYVWLVSFILGHCLGMLMSLLILKRLLFK
ncbi:MAG: hypothetical protein KC427_09620 [Sulfurovum sp.]|uniref:hypothetical protein n=1 Tax=Sulfurovum sp. TaxID=1969726 RepID=UPI002867F845|nr:hypothetical protein [Sulfurovum sp.]MCO4846263.1 hypothetical protein [Sulfurovum sp.]